VAIIEKDDQIVVRISKPLKAKLKVRADQQNMTLTRLVMLSLMGANPELASEIMAEI
jgi:hypothetical protein